MNMRKRIISGCVCAFALMLALFALAGCGETKEAPLKETKAAAGQAGEEEKVYHLGEAGKTDELEITVTKVEKAEEWTKTPEEGLEYVVVFIRARNISKEDQSITGNQFGFVRDEKGNRGSYETYTGVPTELDLSGTMAPGESVEINLIYAMPVDMGSVEFHYTVGYSVNPALRFEFSK